MHYLMKYICLMLGSFGCALNKFGALRQLLPVTYATKKLFIYNFKF